VRWLEECRDDVEQRVREGLDAAAARNDDLALRRVWSRLAELVPGAGRNHNGVPRGRVRWGFLLTVGGLGVGIAAGAWLLRPLMLEAPHRWPSALSFTTGTSAPVTPAPQPLAPVIKSEPLPPEAPPAATPAPDGTPMLLGPAMVRTGAREGRAVRLKSGARVNLRPRTTLIVDAGQRPFLRRGQARMEVPKQPQGETFSVAAGPYVVVVVGTKFGLSVSRHSVKVDVREGVVQVWRGGRMTQLGAGASWKGPVRVGPRPGPRRALARSVSSAPKPGTPTSSAQHPLDSYQEAHAALARGDSTTAISTLRIAAEGTGPAAENAGLELGKILRDQLYQHRQAIVVWTRYRDRFPNGMLRHEADVNIIETLLMLGDRPAARSEIEMFLRRHPHSERQAEMTKMLSNLTGDSGASADTTAARPR
jgi:outer membrane protein assembly factor BamD (BamD/ComL family)